MRATDGPTKVGLDANCVGCNRDFKLPSELVTYIPADESCEWLCPSCGFQNLTRVGYSGD